MNNNTLIELSKERGWRIFPIPADTKAATLKYEEQTWKSYHNWSHDKRQSSFTAHKGNWAVATGQLSGINSCLVVIDVDVKKDIGNGDGFASLEILQNQYGSLPATLTQTTPSGGKHYFFTCDTSIKIKNSVSQIAPHIDIKYEGGYVLIAPSSIDKKHYQWDSDPLTTPIAEIPSTWLQALTQPLSTTSPSLTATRGCIEDNNELIKKACGSIASTTEGKRNTTLNTEAFHLFCKGVPLECASEPLTQAAKQAGLFDEEIECTINSAYNAAQQNDNATQQKDGVEVERLARLSLLQYDRQRKSAAERLGVSVTTLDKAVKHCQAQSQQAAGHTNELFEDVEPWSEPVSGAVLLESICNLLNKHCILPEGADTAIALWVIGTYCFDTFSIFPRLCLSSPEKRCGKTTLVQVLSDLVNHPLVASNATPAVIFRSIEAWQPTLLLDEADTFIHGYEELRGIINSGHTRRTAFVLRTEGDAGKREPKRFSTWAPLALAMIKTPSDTILDRSVLAKLRRKLPDEAITRLPRNFNEQCLSIRQQCQRWVNDSMVYLESHEPTFPNIDNDRAIDNWWPLLTIADYAGDVWPEKARSAMCLLEAEHLEKSSIGVNLLRDIHTIFNACNAEKLGSNDLVEQLKRLPNAPWNEQHQGKPINQSWLAKQLKHFGISPRQLWFEDKKNIRGYQYADFEDTFKRYLIPPNTSARVLESQQSEDLALMNTASEAQNATIKQSIAPTKNLQTAIAINSSTLAPPQRGTRNTQAQTATVESEQYEYREVIEL